MDFLAPMPYLPLSGVAMTAAPTPPKDRCSGHGPCDTRGQLFEFLNNCRLLFGSALLSVFSALLLLLGCQVQVSQIGQNPCNPDPCNTRHGVCSVDAKDYWTGTCTINPSTGQFAGCSSWVWHGTAALHPKDAKGKLAVAPLSYAASDTTCDGLDNNCNGAVDELAASAKPVCPSVGVCGALSSPKGLCLGGKWLCDFSSLPDYQAVEDRCDGKDNDCDGQTDEEVVAKPSDCKRMGVCAALAAPLCTAQGQWDCGYAQAPDYEDKETKCDGKDNDCDGEIDTGLQVSSLKCQSAGVCAGVVQACQGGQAICLYSALSGYQAFETTCDTLDNDCDGKTDNLAGTGLPLVGTETNGCLSLGVCDAFKNQVVKVCSQGSLVCNYNSIPGYQATESACDGLDNDCDGGTDNKLAPPAKNPCGDKGICANGSVLCQGGLFVCDWASLAGQGYEAFEQTCDNKDNDCDGQTDESASPSTSNCLTAGVCAYGTSAVCKTGQGVCDYSHVAMYQAVTETLCDGLDNNCDGKTDEPEGLDASKIGCTVGVCAGKAKATCGGGKWTCDTSAVTAFEAVEKTCDGLDNDCDGLTDESLSDPAAAKCPSQGVCAAGVPSGCVGGKWMCNLVAVKGYEAIEQSCDGVDNDCDGKTDIGVCSTGAACTSNTQCASGNCASTLGGGAKVCVEKAGQCPLIGADGKLTLASDGSTACTEAAKFASCSKGAWGAPAACGALTPVCYAGSCGVCVPNQLSCDPSDKTKIGKCAVDGKSVLAGSSCNADAHCTGQGACAIDGLQTLSDTASAASPQVVALTDGSFAVAWLVDSSNAADVRLRMFGVDGKPKAASAKIASNSLLSSGSGSRLAATAVGTGFAIAWVTSGMDQNISVQLFDGAGATKGPVLIGNSGDNSGAQTEPALASWSGGFVVAWTSDAIEGSGDKGIGAALFDATGAALGTPIIVNDDPANADDPVTGNQTTPAVAVRSTGDIVIAWTHAFGGANAKSRIRARALTSTGTFASGVVVVSDPAANADTVTLSASSGEFLAAWQATSGDGNGNGVKMRHLDALLQALGPMVTANTFVTGSQDQPWLGPLSSGALLIWRSQGAAVGSSNYQVAERDLSANSGFSTDEAVLTSANATGDKDQPRITGFADGRILSIWRSKAVQANGLIEGLFR